MRDCDPVRPIDVIFRRHLPAFRVKARKNLWRNRRGCCREVLFQPRCRFPFVRMYDLDDLEVAEDGVAHEEVLFGVPRFPVEGKRPPRFLGIRNFPGQTPNASRS